MPDLSPEAEDLVRAGRRADHPSDADRERVLGALRARLGDAVVLGHGGAESVAKGARALQTATSRWIALGLAGIAGAALFYGLYDRLHRAPAPPGPPSSVSGMASGAMVAEAPAADPGPTIDLVPEVSAITKQPPTPLPARVRAGRPAEAGPAVPGHDGLSDEVAILSRAETELHSGRFESALRALDEHERRFPGGVLAEERTAARIQALCGLGRTVEADAQLARLARTAPHSPHEERARQACRDALGGGRP